MSNRADNFKGFCVAFLHELKAVIRAHGWRHGWAFTQCWWRDFYTHQREKKCNRVECPICGWEGYDFRMLNCGWFAVPRVECPQCEGHERHRMLHLYLNREHAEFFEEPGTVVHFASETQVRQLIDRNKALRCFTTDYSWYMVENHRPKAFQSDMQYMPLQENSVDTVFCLHVLEHVPDDRKGIGEIRRILKEKGVAYVMVPFMMDWKKTIEFEKPEPTWFDHVRGYAPNDFDDRLDVLDYEKVMPSSFLSEEEIRRYSVPDSQVIYRCVKR